MNNNRIGLWPDFQPQTPSPAPLSTRSNPFKRSRFRVDFGRFWPKMANNGQKRAKTTKHRPQNRHLRGGLDRKGLWLHGEVTRIGHLHPPPYYVFWSLRKPGLKDLGQPEAFETTIKILHGFQMLGLHFSNLLGTRFAQLELQEQIILGRTPKRAYSSRARSRHLLETPFSEPLLRTLLRTLFHCKTHRKRPPSQNPSENPFPRTLPEPSQNPS